MEIETKIVKNGNSYAMAIPKALVHCKILDFGRRYKLKIEPIDAVCNENTIKKFRKYTIGNYISESNKLVSET